MLGKDESESAHFEDTFWLGAAQMMIAFYSSLTIGLDIPYKFSPKEY